jgi:hypothetical protein
MHRSGVKINFLVLSYTGIWFTCTYTICIYMHVLHIDLLNSCILCLLFILCISTYFNLFWASLHYSKIHKILTWNCILWVFGIRFCIFCILCISTYAVYNAYWTYCTYRTYYAYWAYSACIAYSSYSE